MLILTFPILLFVKGKAKEPGVGQSDVMDISLDSYRNSRTRAPKHRKKTIGHVDITFDPGMSGIRSVQRWGRSTLAPCCEGSRKFTCHLGYLNRTVCVIHRKRHCLQCRARHPVVHRRTPVDRRWFSPVELKGFKEQTLLQTCNLI